MKKKVVIIGGPTGVGKSELAFRLAERLEGELISCDSVQVYKDLEIGANKTALGTPGREHLLDLVDWSEDFTAADFHDRCTAKIEEIVQRDRLPILVGGTGFYLDWILRGRPSAPPTDPEALKAVERDLGPEDPDNWVKCFDKLKAVDPEYAKVILKNDFYRLKRALAVHRATGLPLSHYKRSPSKLLEAYDFRCFFITADREFVCSNIDKRCEEMLIKGLLEETFEFSKRGLSADCKAGRSIGYFESLNLLESFKDAAESFDEEENHTFKREKEQFYKFLDEFKAATRQYSRKQENWFASKPEFKWIRRPTPFSPIDPESSTLFSSVSKAIQVPREEYEAQDGWLAAEDALARDLVTEQVRKRMKRYRGPDSRFTGKFLDDYLRKIFKMLKPK